MINFDRGQSMQTHTTSLQSLLIVIIALYPSIIQYIIALIQFSCQIMWLVGLETYRKIMYEIKFNQSHNSTWHILSKLIGLCQIWPS